MGAILAGPAIYTVVAKKGEGSGRNRERQQNAHLLANPCHTLVFFPYLQVRTMNEVNDRPLLPSLTPHPTQITSCKNISELHIRYPEPSLLDFKDKNFLATRYSKLKGKMFIFARKFIG